MLSHELRNPLSAVRSAAALLHKENTDEATRGVCQDIIDRQSAQMASLLDDLLDLTRITRGNIPVRMERVDLRQASDGAIQAVSAMATESKVDILAENPDAPMYVQGDLTRLTQIVTNLLANAVKYSRPDGKVSLEHVRDEDAATIRITDTGIGIDREDLKQVFDMFFQANDDSPTNEGLGIGLTLVKTLAELQKMSKSRMLWSYLMPSPHSPPST